MHVDGLRVERRLVELEVSRVQHDARACMNRQRDAIGHAVRHAQEFDREAADLHPVARPHLGQARPRLGVLLELRFNERERQLRPVNRAFEIRQHVGHRPDVILMPVRQHERLNPVLLQLPQVRNDQIDAEQLRLGKHDAGVHEDRRLAAGDEHHVHAELAEPSERDQFERGSRYIRVFRSVVHTQNPRFAAFRSVSSFFCMGHAAAGAAQEACPSDSRWDGCQRASTPHRDTRGTERRKL